MIKTLFFLFLAFLFTSCSGQEVKVSIINKSSAKIDSVIFPYVKGKLEGEINPGQAKSTIIYLKSEQLKREGSFPILIYQKGKSFSSTYGFHDWGKISQKENNLYFFDNGINTKDLPLKKPEEFTLFVVDQSTTPTDSITVKPQSLKRIVPLAKSIEIVVDFEEFSNEPILIISRKGFSMEVRVDRDWNNWNFDKEIIYINDAGIVLKK